MWFFTLAFAADVNIETGATARAGDRAYSPSTGVSVTLPPGTQGVVVGDAFQVQGPNNTWAQIGDSDGLTVDKAWSLASSGLSVGDAVLFPVGQPIRGTGQLDVVLAGQTLLGEARHGRAHLHVGASALLLVAGSNEASVDATYRGLRSSLRYQSPKAPVSAVRSPPSGGPAGQWASVVAGHTLHRYNTGSSTTFRMSVDLCSDGRAYFSSGGSGGGGSVSYASSSADQGTWTVRGNQIISTWSDGSTDTRTMSWGPNGEFMVDGVRWLRQDSKRCR